MRFHKTIVFLILVFFAVPIATAFCCCTDFGASQSRQKILKPHHDCDGHGSQTNNSTQQKNESSPESCECGNEIIANVVNPTTIHFSAINTHFTKLQNDSIFRLRTVSALQAQNLISYHDAGPPGIFSSTPLYLQISILRI